MWFEQTNNIWTGTQVTEKYSGLAITPKELQKFMIEEQARVFLSFILARLEKLQQISQISRVTVFQLMSAPRSSGITRWRTPRCWARWPTSTWARPLFSGEEKSNTGENILQVCYELFPFPNHQQSDGWKCLPGDKIRFHMHLKWSNVLTKSFSKSFQCNVVFENVS